MVLTPEMRRIGVTPNLMKTTQKISCPRCGLEFSLFQSRAIACKGCSKGAYGCNLARCLRCDHEFPVNGPLVAGRERDREISEYMSAIVDNYNKSVGKKGTR